MSEEYFQEAVELHIHELIVRRESNNMTLLSALGRAADTAADRLTVHEWGRALAVIDERVQALKKVSEAKGTQPPPDANPWVWSTPGDWDDEGGDDDT